MNGTATSRAGQPASSSNGLGALPNLIIIGARKCGTTSLHHYLDLHPEIAMSHPKELNFFCSSDWRERIDWYRQQFPAAAPVRGEGTPAYSTHPSTPGVAERVHALVPDAKLIYLVRDPLERIVAQWVEWYSNEVDLTPEAVNARMAGRPLSEVLQDYENPHNPYVCPSRYATQLECYLRFFAPAQILVVDQHDLRTKRAGTIREVHRFLEVDDTFESAAFFEERNTHAEKFRPQATYSRLRRSVLSAGANRIPPAIRRPIGRPLRRAFSRKVERPTIDQRILRGLAPLLEEEADRLRELTGKGFATWSV